MTVSAGGLGDEDRAALVDLQNRFDTAYRIGSDGVTWLASPFGDPSVVLKATTAGQLDDLIRVDYHVHGRPNLRSPRSTTATEGK